MNNRMTAAEFSALKTNAKNGTDNAPVTDAPTPADNDGPGFTRFEAGPGVEVMMGNSVEIAADIISRFGLSPKDMISLAAAMCCAVASKGNEKFHGDIANPFGHIDTSDGCNPFKTAIAVLSVVDGWNNDNDGPPEPAAVEA